MHFAGIRRAVRASSLAAIAVAALAIGVLVPVASVLAAGPGESPILTSAASRKVHGAAGTFDLPLALDSTNPTTEPRQGPTQTIVFVFDKPVIDGSAFVTEGTASVGAITFGGNEMIVPLTGVTNLQYVTVAVTGVGAADGGTGGSAAVRVGYLAGDVSRNRVVTLSDLGQVNAQVAQFVTGANFLVDVNASGTLSLADKGLTNTFVTKVLTAVPAPANAPPHVSAGTNQSVTLPAVANLTGSASDDSPPGTLTFNWSKISGPGSVTFGTPNAAATSATFGAAGVYVLRLMTSDGVLSNADDVTVIVAPEDSSLPPDPVTVASPTDPTVATSMLDATAFLYSSANPIQTGVVPGTIAAKRAAVLRGGVLDGNNFPLPGVTITILGHPEFGQTLSRADGRFDLAVNGGDTLTVTYAKNGYLPVQRQIHVPWADYAVLPDILMIAPDGRVTAIDLNSPAPIQAAHGNPVTDSDGTRQATVLFPAGTQATLVMPDGSTQPLTTLNVRATEYTVGPNGPARMPAALPPASGYTYAVELSVDEALAVGASEVRFSSPVPFYVENFLGFPVGIAVPLGSYDRSLGVWISADSGRVIKVLSVAAGAAELDVDGDGLPDNAAALAALSITDAERQRLASLYSPGQSVWRVLIAHFSPYDLNWPAGPPSDAVTPAQDPDASKPLDDSCQESGNSIIECQNQILGETIGLVGTPFRLQYQSERVPGRKAANSVEIPLSGSVLPSSLQRIDLQVQVAGRQFRQSFAPLSNQSTTFTWDGKDGYGRALAGSQPITALIGYTYRQLYRSTPRFGSNGPPGSLVTSARDVVTLWRKWQSRVGAWDARGSGLGGWTLSAHHSYDPAEQVLYRGDGGRHSAQALGATISRFTGGVGAPCHSGDGGQAILAGICPRALAVGADGSLYIAVLDVDRVRRVAPNGIITTVAGNGVHCASPTAACGDGGQATQAQLGWPIAIAIGPDGSLYIAENASPRVRKVSPNGIITTIAGTGVAGFSGDGGQAALAELREPRSIAIAPDNSVYIGDRGNFRLRRIDAGGIITTVAGTGVACNPTTAACGDGGAAALAQVDAFGLAVGRDGSLYLLSNSGRLRRVTPDGIIRTIAGTGSGGNSDDGVPAIEAQFISSALAIGPDDTIYITDRSNSRVRWMRRDGPLNTLAGIGNFPSSGDGGLARQANLQSFVEGGLAVAPDGNVYVSQLTNSNRVRRIAPSGVRNTGTEFIVPAKDGSEIYVFSLAYRHLQTKDAITGAPRYQFAYDIIGRLSSVTDVDGNFTTVQRDGSGNPTAVVGPFGQSTALMVNSNGFLSQITSPAGENVQLGYTADGLLTSLTNPRGHASSYTFDTLGRLTGATDPTGATKTIARAGTNGDYTVTNTTALGRMTHYRVERLSNGSERRTTTDPAGNQTQTVNGRNGNQTVIYPDGTTVAAVFGPDPRWGMQAPLAASVVVTTPGGKVNTTTTQRTVTLTNPSDVLSLATMNETATINGRVFATAYNAASRTFTTTSPTGRQATSVVDLLGKPVQVQFGGLAARSFTYDPKGRLATNTDGSGAGSRTTTFAYGVNGFLQSATDAAGRTSAVARDADGRITDQTLPDGAIVRVTYDANGNVIAVAPPGRPNHAFTYDQRDQASTYTAPVVGAQDSQTLSTYDADRQPLQVERPDGQSMGFQYDGAGRQSLVDIVLGDVQYAYDTAGRLASLNRDQGAALDYTYDGGLPTGTAWSGVITGSVTRAYDSNFRVTSLVVNGGTPIALAYDLDGLPVQVGALTLTRNAQNALVTGATLGTITETMTYDAFGAEASHAVSRSGSAVYATTYARDALGRIATRNETIGGVARTLAYTYDLAGRLSEVRDDGVLTTSYGYDGNGNRLSRIDGGGTAHASYDTQDRLDQFGSTTYVHSANGERQSRTAAGQTTTYQYDTTGKLTGVALPGGPSITYLLDGRQRRVGRKQDGTLVQGFLYQDGLKPIAELDSGSNVVSRFVYATGVNAPAYMIKAGVTYRIVTDHLGSPRLVIDAATGSVVQRLDYDEFGKVTLDTNPGFQPFGFAGGLHDPVTGLVHYGTREYEPETGRWITKDSIGFRGGDTNLYGYALNDPVNRVDPQGTAPYVSPLTGRAVQAGGQRVLAWVIAEEAVVATSSAGTVASAPIYVAEVAAAGTGTTTTAAAPVIGGAGAACVAASFAVGYLVGYGLLEYFAPHRNGPGALSDIDYVIVPHPEGLPDIDAVVYPQR